MKKLNVKALLAVVVVLLSVGLLLVFFKGGNKEKDTDKSLTTATTYKTEVEKKINEEIDRLETENTEGWKKAYLDLLNDYYCETEEERVFLGYVDDDDVPELFISEGWFHYCTVEVYTFENNIVTLLCETGSNGMVNYFERQGILCGHYVGMGTGTYWVYSIDNGKVQEIYNAFTNEGWAGEEFDIERRINGIDVTEDELDEFLDSYFDKEKSTCVFDEANPGYELKNEEYKDYINGFGK